MMKIHVLTLALATAFCSVQSYAADASIGMGAHVWDSGYRSVDAETYAVPALWIETEHFYVKGFEAGAYLFKTDRQRLRLGLSYMPLSFDASDSDDIRMKQLDDRDDAIFAKVGYALDTGFGWLNVELGADISGKSDGMQGDVSLTKRFAFGQFGLTPQVGAVWTSEKFNDYYYGISQAESDRSGLHRYEADSGISPYARIVADWQVTDRILLYAEGSIRTLNKEIKDSPMMEDNIMYGFGCGVSYRF